jgi:hypothetical protein
MARNVVPKTAHITANATQGFLTGSLMVAR